MMRSPCQRFASNRYPDRCRSALIEPLEQRQMLSVGPQVTGIQIGGSDWSVEMQSHVAELTNYDPALGLSEVDERSTLPWVNADEIRVHFDQNVMIRSDALRVRGERNLDYSIRSFEYDVAQQIGIWRLNKPFVADHITLELADYGVLGLAQQPLDGEFAEATERLPSGNGQPGGLFRYQFNILAGDVTGNGSVGIEDVDANMKAQFSFIGVDQYFTPADVDGNGKVNFQDAIAIRNHLGMELSAPLDHRMYLQIPGISGDATEQGHTGWIEISSVNLPITRSIPERDTCLRNLTIEVPLDSAMSKLWELMARGTPVPDATIHVTSTLNGLSVVNVEWELSNVILNGYEGGFTQVNPMQTIALNYTALASTYRKFDDQGNETGIVGGSYSDTTPCAADEPDLGSMSKSSQWSGAPEFAMYLKLPGIQGDVEEPSHLGWIEITSMDLQITRPPSSGGGGGASEPNLHDLTFEVPLDSAMSKLWEVTAQGRFMPEAVVHVTSIINGRSELNVEWKFDDVILTSYEAAFEPTGAPQQTLQMNYTALESKYRKFDHKGKFAGTVSGEYRPPALQYSPSPSGIIARREPIGAVQEALPKPIPSAILRRRTVLEARAVDTYLGRDGFRSWSDQDESARHLKVGATRRRLVVDLT